MKKELELITAFAAVFLGCQFFGYLQINGLVWNTSSFINHLILYFAVFAAYSILVLLYYRYFKKPSSKQEEPLIDERIEQMHSKFTGFMFLLSHLILSGVTGYLMLKGQSTVPSEYVLYYSFATLFITMVIAPIIIKK
ncbi:hypothetical protein HOO54_12385 [Bacillus sp. WMMC1349]|uniref:hypothetical protein n=1 Tax=Bacillus sp. WMMC1349 TaxID=2736254 RepID=UPI0015551A39|nr:hypothetical protein [Bacillus sp. WMMC1349]NPC93006.1 hypothetical protein [Bacillus sp. WMMC1349]